MLNLDQVHTFLAVAGHLHFGKAAEDLYISQSAVSASVAKLETQLRVPLFHRIGRRVQLTDAGRFLLSSDIRFWSSGDTKTGPPDGLLIEALRRLLDRCFIGV